jgi:hypothetical protein
MPIEKFKVDVQGYRELKAKIRSGGDPLIGEPMVAAMQAIGIKAERLAEQAAPMRSGRLKASIRSTVSGVRPVPDWVKVEAPARATRSNPGGRRRNRTTGKLGRPWKRYAYPRRLNYEAGNKHFHWLTNVVDKMRPSVGQFLDAVARAVEMKWGF